jgi:hypothetical protein
MGPFTLLIHKKRYEILRLPDKKWFSAFSMIMWYNINK